MVEPWYCSFVLLDDEGHRSRRLQKLVGVLSKALRVEVGRAAIREKLR